MKALSSVKISLFALLATAFVASCSEEEPVGLFDVVADPLLDTCYTMQGAAPSPELKNVLLYDVTGVRCSNCPKAAEQVKKILDKHGNRVAAIALYADIPGLGQLTDAWEGFPVLNTVDAQQLIASLGNPGSLPTGCVDQIEVNNNRMISFLKWDGEITKRLPLSTPANLELTASFDPSNNSIRVNTKTTFTSAFTDPVMVFVALTENDIESKQSENRVSSGHVDDYKHEHVLRTLPTGSAGSEIQCNAVSGLVAEKQYSIKKENNWKVADMHALVWIVNKTTKEVLHVKEVSVK